MVQASAPLDRPHQKMKVKQTAAPPVHPAKGKRAKRPRPSDASDVDKPLRKKDPSKAKGSPLAGAGLADPSSYKKGMYLAFVDDAFARRAKGDNERYDELVAQFRSLIPSMSASTSTLNSNSASPSTAQLRVWLDALTHVVSKLDKSHAPLVETIIDLPWATMEDSFVSAYVRFLGALVSARAEWLRSVLQRCVKGFRYRSNYTTGSPASMPLITRRTLYGRLHTLLRMLISLVPTLSPTLSPLLTAHFPSKRDNRTAQICYIDNLLSLTEYCPALSEDVLTLVIERALNIDVEIQGDPEDWEEVEEGMEEEKVLGVKELVDRPTAEDDDDDSSDDDDDDDGEFDLDDLDSDDEPDPVSDDEAARKTKGDGALTEAAIRKILENRRKLDAILKVVLDHLAVAHALVPISPEEAAKRENDAGVKANGNKEETTPTPEVPATPEAIERRLSLFRTVLDIFDRTLLRTFKTRNTQFILFYLCSLNYSSSDHFIGVLLGRALFELEAPAVTRVAAAGYVASFVSRATFIDASMTRKVVRHLCTFLENQMEDHASGSETGSQHLPVFYAVAQAVFYIFCFRWKDLVDDEGDEDEIVGLETGRRWMMGLETVKKTISSSFNPLKVCAQPVVTQFASIAHKTNFLYCYAIIDANRRSSARESFPLPPSSGTSAPRATLSSSATAQLPRQLLVAEEMDSFFPFDPFKLPLSSLYIDNIYRTWESEDGSASEASSEDTDDDYDSSSESDTDTEDEAFYARAGGLAVPGVSKADEEDDEVFSKSFEAMSLSPDRSAFGGRVGSLPMTPLVL